MSVWLSGNVLVFLNVVALRRARLLLGWVTVHGYTILVFNQSHPGYAYSGWPYPSVGRHNEYWRWSKPSLGKKRRVLRNSGPVPGQLAYWPSRLKALVAMGPRRRGSYASLIGLTLAGLKAYERG